MRSTSPARTHSRRRDAVPSSPAWTPTLPLLRIGLVVLLIAGCGDDKKETTEPPIRHPQDFLPQSVSGLAKDGAVRVATTATELQEIVDGGYQVYTSHGFRELAEQNYTGTVGGTQTSLLARLFDQETEANATALHADENINTGGCSPSGGIGDDARYCPSFISQSIQFRRGQYWVQLAISDVSPDGRTVLELFAQHIDSEIQEK